jgi:hypothetical protein
VETRGRALTDDVAEAGGDVAQPGEGGGAGGEREGLLRRGGADVELAARGDA